MQRWRDASAVDRSTRLVDADQSAEVVSRGAATARSSRDKLEELFGKSFDGPELSNIARRNDGTLGEVLARQELGRRTGLDLRSLQNNSGHGADLVGIDKDSNTVWLFEVKSSHIGVGKSLGEVGTPRPS